VVMWEPSDEDLRLMREVFFRTAADFGCQVVNEDHASGWRGRTLGGRVVSADANRWLRVAAAPAERRDEKLWLGTESAQTIVGASRPVLLETEEWTADDLRFRAELSTFIPDAPVSSTPELREDVSLTEAWWRCLDASLEAVAQTATDRVSIRQDLVNRRLDWISAGQMETGVAEWTASHGDLHWANLTAPDCFLLDWEAWGLAPAGWDAALLRAYSLLRPAMAQEVARRFSDRLNGPGGRQIQLFAVAELLLSSSRGDHPDLVPPLLELASQLLGEPVEVIARRVT
jgi:hypothetical protein